MNWTLVTKHVVSLKSTQQRSGLDTVWGPRAGIICIYIYIYIYMLVPIADSRHRDDGEPHGRGQRADVVPLLDEIDDGREEPHTYACRYVYMAASQ